MSRLTLTILAAAGITLIAGVWFLVPPFADTEHSLLSILATIGKASIAAEPTTPVADPDSDASLPFRYFDPAFGFSFIYRSLLSFETSQDDDGYLLVATTPELRQNFQVFLSELPSGTTLTSALIEQDLPFSTRGEITATTLPDGTPAFWVPAEDPNIGPTLEILFQRDAFLYQVTTHPEAEDHIRQILSTWRFSP